MREVVEVVNGIELCSALNPSLKSFCLSLYVRAGSIFEDASSNGITHLFEHIAFRNLKSKYEDFYNLLALHGVSLDGATYKEFLHFSLNGPEGELGFATDVLCSLFDEIRIRSEELEKEKRRIKAEIRERDERNTLDYFFQRIIWKDSEAEKTIIGSCKVLDRISLRRLNQLRGELLSKGNCIVFVTGSASPSDLAHLKEKIEALDIRESQRIRTNTVSVGKDFFHRSLSVNVKNGYWHKMKIGFDVDQGKFSNGVLEMLYAVLFRYENALAYRYLSEDTPIVYSYDSTLEQYDNVANLNFKFEFQEDKLEDAVKTVVLLLNDVKAGRFHFEASQRAEMYNTATEVDRPENLNWSLAYYNHILRTRAMDCSDAYYGIFNVTKEQVTEAAREIFRLRNMTIAIQGDKRKIKLQGVEDCLRMLDE